MSRPEYLFNGDPLSANQIGLLRAASRRTRCVYNGAAADVRQLVDIGLMKFHPSPAWFPGGFVSLTEQGRNVVGAIERWAEMRREILHGAN